MKKFLLMMAVVAMMVACGNKQQAKAEPTKENAEQTGPYKFSVANHITGTTGSTNCSPTWAQTSHLKFLVKATASTLLLR